MKQLLTAAVIVWSISVSAQQRFGVAGEDNKATQLRSFNAARNGFIIDSINSLTIRSTGSAADSAMFRMQINRALEKHLLSEFTEPNGVRFGKVETGTDDPENFYILNEVRSRGVSVFSTIMESGDSSMSTVGYRNIWIIDSSGPRSGIFFKELKTAPSLSNIQLLVRDSSDGAIYRLDFPPCVLSCLQEWVNKAEAIKPETVH